METLLSFKLRKPFRDYRYSSPIQITPSILQNSILQKTLKRRRPTKAVTLLNQTVNNISVSTQATNSLNLNSNQHPKHTTQSEDIQRLNILKTPSSAKSRKRKELSLMESLELYQQQAIGSIYFKKISQTPELNLHPQLKLVRETPVQRRNKAYLRQIEEPQRTNTPEIPTKRVESYQTDLQLLPNIRPKLFKQFIKKKRPENKFRSKSPLSVVERTKARVVQLKKRKHISPFTRRVMQYLKQLE